MKQRMIKTVLVHETSIDSMTVGQALGVLQRYDNNAKIEFLARWEFDTDFSITLEREQTPEEALEAERQMQELINYQAAPDYKEYESMNSIYEKRDLQ